MAKPPIFNLFYFPFSSFLETKFYLGRVIRETESDLRRCVNRNSRKLKKLLDNMVVSLPRHKRLVKGALEENYY